MLTIYLGGISGSGKTTLAEQYRDRCHVLNMDFVAREVGTAISPFGKSRLYWSPDFWEFFGETAYLEEAFRVGLMRGFGGLFPLTKPLLAEGNLLVRSPAFLNGFRRGLVSLGRSLDDERFLFLDIDIATVIERAQQRGRPGEQDRSREQMEAIRRESLALASRFEIITTNDQGAVKLNQWLSVAK